MKKFLTYLKTRPLGFISLIFLIILYLFMIFAEFIAPYSPSATFETATFHPANIEISSGKLKAREFRVLNQSSWQYAKVKGLNHEINFFVKGSPYKLFGLVECNIHLFGTLPSSAQEKPYPVFLFGADNLGRDLFSRMVYGSRISLTIGFVASAISLLLAVVLGGIAGYFGGGADWSIMRVSEFFMLIPSLYLILFLRSILNSTMDSGMSYMIITLILSLVGWPGSARTFRGIVHSIKREDYIQNAKSEGIPAVSIIFRYIIPQTASLLIVSTTLSIPGFIMSETTLSYLGLGIADPAVSWGSLINREISTLSNLRNFPWLLMPVWLLLSVTLAFNFIGDALRDYFDPYHVVFKKGFKKSKKGESLPLAPKPDSSSPDCCPKKTWPLHSGLSATPSSGDTPQRPDILQNKSSLLSVENLRVTFLLRRGKNDIFVQAVRGVSFNVAEGEILGIVGESGSGKSVSTAAVTGLLPENAFVEGNIYYRQNEKTENLLLLNNKQLRRFRGREIGMIFQESSRVFDPLQSMESAFFETFSNSFPGITPEESAEKAASLLAETGIPDGKSRLKNFPHQFSGGQLQRIGIALALAQGCRLLIADEPTTALDVTVQAQITELLLQLNKTRNLSIIFISHDIGLVSRLCSRIIVMYGGKIMEEGKTEDIVKNPKNPYTKALISAMPRFGTHYKVQKLSSIPGKVTEPSNPEPGCPFEPRCSFAVQNCRNADYTCPFMTENKKTEGING